MDFDPLCPCLYFCGQLGVKDSSKKHKSLVGFEVQSLHVVKWPVKTITSVYIPFNVLCFVLPFKAEPRMEEPGWKEHEFKEIIK